MPSGETRLVFPGFTAQSRRSSSRLFRNQVSERRTPNLCYCNIPEKRNGDPAILSVSLHQIDLGLEKPGGSRIENCLCCRLLHPLFAGEFSILFKHPSSRPVFRHVLRPLDRRHFLHEFRKRRVPKLARKGVPRDDDPSIPLFQVFRIRQHFGVFKLREFFCRQPCGFRLFAADLRRVIFPIPLLTL